MKDFDEIVRALKDQFLLDANFYKKEIKSNIQNPGESTVYSQFFQKIRRSVKQMARFGILINRQEKC